MITSAFLYDLHPFFIMSDTWSVDIGPARVNMLPVLAGLSLVGQAATILLLVKRYSEAEMQFVEWRA